MIEYVQARVLVNNFTMFTVINVKWEDEAISFLKMESILQINLFSSKYSECTEE